MNVTLLEITVFADVINQRILRWNHSMPGWVENPAQVSLQEWVRDRLYRQEEETQRRTWYKDSWRDYNNVSASQGMPMIAGSHQSRERQKKKYLPLHNLKGM